MECARCRRTINFGVAYKYVKLAGGIEELRCYSCLNYCQECDVLYTHDEIDVKNHRFCEYNKETLNKLLNSTNEQMEKLQKDKEEIIRKQKNKMQVEEEDKINDE